MQNTNGLLTEYLSKDILDSEFVRTFVVIHRLQFILGSCRVYVRDHFVTAPTRYQKVYTVLCIFITVLLNLVAMNMITYIGDTRLYYLCLVQMWGFFGIYFSVMVHARLCNGQDNAIYFVLMQKIDRLMKLDKNKDINTILKNINNLSMFTLLAIFFGIILVVGAKMLLDYSMFVGAIYFQLTVMIELTYCSNLVIYFFVRLRFLNCIIKNHLSQKKKTNKRTLNIVSNRKFRIIASETHDFLTSDTYSYLKELFDLFSMFQNLYRFPLFVFCLKLIFGSLSVFGVTLILIQSNSMTLVDILPMSVFIVIDIFIAGFLGLRLQLFFGEVKETKRLSIAVMAAYPTGQLRKKARKMLKMAEETPPTLSIYDMFEMDAGIFLTLFSLITTLIVTILQFAIL